VSGGGGMRKELAYGAIGSMSIKLIGAVLTILLTMLLARILGVEGYGTYTYVLSIVSLLAIPAQMGLPNLLVRETAKAHINQDWSLMRGLWYWSGGLVAIISIIIAFFSWLTIQFWQSRFTEEQITLFTVGLTLVPLLALGNLRDGALRGLHFVILGQLPEVVLRPGLLLISILILQWCGWILHFTPLQIMTLNAVWALITFLIAAVILQNKQPDALRDVERRYEQRCWFQAAWPLACLAGMQLINQHIATLVLGYFVTVADVAVFKVVTSVAGAVGFGLYSVNTMIAPYFAKLYAQKEKQKLQYLVSLSSGVILIFCVPIAIMLVVFGNEVLLLMFGAEYVRGYEALLILVIGQLINSITGSVSILLNMTGFERDTVKAFSISAVINILCNLFAVPYWGVLAAAYASAIGMIVWNMMLIIVAYRRLDIVSVAFYSFWPKYKVLNI